MEFRGGGEGPNGGHRMILGRVAIQVCLGGLAKFQVDTKGWRMARRIGEIFFLLAQRRRPRR